MAKRIRTPLNEKRANESGLTVEAIGGEHMGMMFTLERRATETHVWVVYCSEEEEGGEESFQVAIADLVAVEIKGR